MVNSKLAWKTGCTEWRDATWQSGGNRVWVIKVVPCWVVIIYTICCDIQCVSCLWFLEQMCCVFLNIINWHLSRRCDVFSWRQHKLWLIILAINNAFSRSSIRFITTKTKQPHIWHGSNRHCVLDLGSKWMPQAKVCFRLPEPRKTFSAFTGVCVCFCVFVYFCSR